jgi:hypothetical protein
MKRDEEAEMNASRANDPPDSRPTRVVSWTSVLSLALGITVPMAGAVAAFWISTVEQGGITRTEIRHMNESIQDLKAEVKTTNIQLSAKSSKDAEQDAKILDQDRRITRLESR